MMGRNHSSRLNGGDDNRWQGHTVTPSGCRYSAGITWVTDALFDLHCLSGQWLEQYVLLKGLSLVDDLSRLVTQTEIHQVNPRHERYTMKSIEWDSTPGLHFDTAETKVELFIVI